MRRSNLIRTPLALALAAGAALPVAGDDGNDPGSGSGHYVVVGWNDLGMHCMDSDYSVFSILPPFNDLKAQLIDPSGRLVTALSGRRLEYTAVADPTGSINKSSIGKTNYWSHVAALFGVALAPDRGLAGHDMPGAANTPQLLAFDGTTGLFAADGIPITPFDDSGHHRTYPLLQVTARDSAGTALASATPVIPVSDEMDCRLCHGSGSADAAKPAAGWGFERNAERDYRLNILRLHDEQHLADPAYAAALQAAGYSAAGLYDQAKRLRSPILCAACHASNALPGTGQAGITPLTEAVHSGHAAVADPETGLPLDASANRASCYRCHPGSETRCLRGAMGGAVAPDGELAMQCQSCHGSMNAVGASGRVGWLDQPSCQNCHSGTATSNNGQIRYDSVFEPDGSRRVAVDATFATNADVPAAGFDLYRFSFGHGGLACEACHGSTHAEYPGAHPNDNLQSSAFQGHVGVLSECASCHGNDVRSWEGGPHGMHSLGQSWVDDHGDAAQQLGTAACQRCHGSNDRGTVLSRAQADRALTTRYGTKDFFRGQTIGCWECHRGPDDDNQNDNRAPHANDLVAATVDTPVTVTLSGSDADGNALTWRIVRQPSFGRVGLAGTLATYLPDPGFAGSDTFAVAASDGSSESNLGTVTISRGATWSNYGLGYPGTGGVIPAFTLDHAPQFGTTIHATLGNPSGQATFGLLIASTERAALPTSWGGVLLSEVLLQLVLPIGAGGETLDFDVPDDPTLTGLNEHVQVLELDQGARYGMAFTRGLRLTLGE